MMYRTGFIEFAIEELHLHSATNGFHFQARIRGRYKRGRTKHVCRESYVHDHVSRIARKIAQEWDVDEAAAAESAINAVLGKPAKCQDRIFRDLTASVVLSLSNETLHAFIQLRHDQARVERLRFLKEHLYAEPVLLAIEFLERNPENIEIDDLDVHKFFEFANKVQHAERWWAPLMHAWSELAKQTQSTEAVGEAMKVLLEAIQRLDFRLTERFELPTPPIISSPNDLQGDRQRP
jgi:hypothetical protein